MKGAVVSRSRSRSGLKVSTNLLQLSIDEVLFLFLLGDPAAVIVRHLPLAALKGDILGLFGQVIGCEYFSEVGGQQFHMDIDARGRRNMIGLFVLGLLHFLPHPLGLQTVVVVLAHHLAEVLLVVGVVGLVGTFVPGVDAVGRGRGLAGDGLVDYQLTVLVGVGVVAVQLGLGELAKEDHLGQQVFREQHMEVIEMTLWSLIIYSEILGDR